MLALKAPSERLVSPLQSRSRISVPPEPLLNHYEERAYGNHGLLVLSGNDQRAKEWDTKGLFTRPRVGHGPGSVQRRILRLHDPGLSEGWVNLG